MRFKSKSTNLETWRMREREKREWSILIMRNWPKNVINIILENHYAMEENFVDNIIYVKIARE